MTRLRVTAAVALVAVAALSAALPEAQAGPKAGPDVSAPFYVTLFTPTRGQQMLPDLSDPGANNVITIRFSTFPLKRDVLDGPEVAGVTGLSARCWFRDQAFRTIKVTAFVRRNVLTIDPFSIQQPVLPQGAYRLTLRSSIRSLGGRLLNDGRSDFNTFFTVGTPPFPPVFLRSTPADGADGVSRRRAVVLSFDEELEAASAEGAVRVEDRSTVPPTPVASVVRLARRGRDVVVAPATREGWPADTELTVVVAGRGTATDASATVLTAVPATEFRGYRGPGVDDVEFQRDHGPRWTADATTPTLFRFDAGGEFDDVTGEMTLSFRTRGAAAK